MPGWVGDIFRFSLGAEPEAMCYPGWISTQGVMSCQSELSLTEVPALVGRELLSLGVWAEPEEAVGPPISGERLDLESLGHFLSKRL